MLVGDPAQLPDFDAAELTSPQQAVHFVAADLQDLRDLLDCVCLQGPHLLGLWLALVRGRLLSCWLQCVLVRSFVHVHVCTPIRADARGCGRWTNFHGYGSSPPCGMARHWPRVTWTARPASACSWSR